MWWAGHVERMREIINTYIMLVAKPKFKRHLGDLGVDGRIMLK
jgi:hypothetical protein